MSSIMVASSLRSVRAPLQALVRRQYSSAAGTATIGHSTKKLAIASGVSAAVGADVTYAYFTFFKKNDGNSA
ncbi:hypothetical protein BX616_003927 [Lobosporangium transversale]|uniref:Uncharacterized protein n=1 Tax=Lobosporangium transversale TaxID=64571 RepID=A0A1Y2GMJ1_9FUNG|nr:hypothetical protein BCR41DRAFT_397077 [Lobosporangium transversale]KAF9916376.1 hypothetical protein BX616_003927 [Lobosporangium transversale]ORZ13928.1 hypothetical protein BCR41DRAFT_397077 [Lobosporangium transversale]|eukprot:XP_021880712.1 hypothetical protein BCR41DRAFT_397077 [Lobosporangium transversale]